MAADKKKGQDDAPALPGGRPAPIVFQKSAMAKPVDPAPEPSHKLPKRPLDRKEDTDV